MSRGIMPRHTEREISAVKELYLKGLGCRRIVAELTKGGFEPCPTEKTIDLWVRKYKWRDLRLKLRQKRDDILVTTLAQVNKMHFDTAQEVIDKAMEVLRKDEMELSASDIERMAKLQRLVFGEATERTGVAPAVIEMPVWFKPKTEKNNETKTEAKEG